MARFIRLQSNKYDIDEESMSFPWEYGNSVYEAMLEFIGYEMDARSPDGDHPLKEIYYDILEEDDISKVTEDVEVLWNDMGQPGPILNGVSCYAFDEEEKEAAHELLEYFQTRDSDALDNDDYYVLIFEGEVLNEDGHNGEDLATWGKDIERVPTKEFFSRYGLEVK